MINLPINYYAGYILNNAAIFVENRMAGLNDIEAKQSELDCTAISGNEGETRSIENMPMSLLEKWDDEDDEPTETTEIRQSSNRSQLNRVHHGIDTEHTFDFIGLTYSLFDANQRREHEQIYVTAKTKISRPTMLVTVVYYTNIFLVLGNYILVMSHAVAAIIGEENICLPTAGVVASSLMFAISQLRTMAMLGRSASAISLLALAIVVLQCLFAIWSGHEGFSYQDDKQDETFSDVSLWQGLVQQLAALSSIGFAVGR